MAFNGSGLFQIDTAGQPVVAGQTIDADVFNALTADLASGLTTCITKDGQTTVAANIPFGGYRLTGIGYGTSSTDAARVDQANALNMCEGRLTLTTGVPVTTADVTAAETVYFAPYKGNRIALFDGTNWYMRTFTELSIDVPDATSMYDVFAYDNAGTVTLELTAWTNDTTRATALTTQNGVLSKTGALTRRYLGSFYCTTAGNGQTTDSVANRYLWNYYNRALKPMRVLSASNWNYTTAAIRQANASSTNQLNFAIGFSEDSVSASIMTAGANTNVGVAYLVGIGIDVTNDFSAGNVLVNTVSQVANQPTPLLASIKCFPGVGKHFLSWNEVSAATGTTTFYGGFATGSCGIHGEIWC